MFVSKTETHSDDLAVDQFAVAMKEKLAIARAKGRGGWQECPESHLVEMLREHVAKGDMRDVANIAMMIYLNRETELAKAALKLPRPLNPTTAPPEPAFALVDASGRIDPMSVRRYSTTVEIYAGMRRLENQGGFRIIPVIITEGKNDA